jgi:hypothetical protein
MSDELNGSPLRPLPSAGATPAPVRVLRGEHSCNTESRASFPARPSTFRNDLSELADHQPAPDSWSGSPVSVVVGAGGGGAARRSSITGGGAAVAPPTGPSR